jgi:hypothetical protein
MGAPRAEMLNVHVPRASAMRVAIRFCTAIVIIGICGLSVARGSSIVRFSFAMVNIESLKNRAEVTHPWSAVPGVASRALQAELADKIDPSKAAISRRERLSAILSIKPLSSSDWFALCQLRLKMDQPMEQVLETLTLSLVTGPNEGYIMPERGILGLYLWEDLSADLKWRAARDLATGGKPDSEKFRTVLALKPEAVRNELGRALLAAGLSAEEVDRRLRF